MESEKIVFIEFDKQNATYIPERGWVIRDMKMYDNKAVVWLQKSNYLN